jgi:hypothetical protein
MAKIGIILISDYHYGIVRNHYSLTEMIRSDIINSNLEDEYYFRHIVAKNISSMCRVYPHKLDQIREFCKTNDMNIFVIGLGISNYKSGYDYDMYRNHVKGLILEVKSLTDNCFVTLLNAVIDNKLKGNFYKNYDKISKIIDDIGKNLNCNVLKFNVKILFLNNGDYVISTHTIPNMIKSISKDAKFNKKVFFDKNTDWDNL